MYLVKRHDTWWALHDIPRALRDAIGKPRFACSLETADKSEAQRRAAPLEVRWRGEIERARRGTPDDPMTRDAAFWRRTLAEAKDDGERETILDFIGDEAERRADEHARRRGVSLDDVEAYEKARDDSDAKRFVGLATGKDVPLDEHLDEFLATLRIENKSRDQKRATVLRFKARFPLANDVGQRGLQEFVNEAATAGLAPATIRRHLSELRTYWRYLASLGIVPRYPPPFDGLTVPNASGKRRGQVARRGFEASEVVALLNAANSRGDQQLADLIQLAMYTGARIEELCALKLEKVSKAAFEIEDAKSEAGWRIVPIHPKLAKTVAQLGKRSSDGFLLSGLGSKNKYGDRSPAIGKRFGRLKRELGFPETKVFHSIRKTVSTLLEQAGVPENVAADILGHDKPTMTYGLYAEGSSFDQRKSAIAKLRYPTQRTVKTVLAPKVAN